MVDRNNLNRIKGILSARQGAEIPKFQEGAKFKKSNGSNVIYSNNYIDWYEDEAMTTRYTGDGLDYGDLIEAATITAKGKPIQSVSTPSQVVSPNDGAVVLKKDPAVASEKVKSYGMDVLPEGESEMDRKAKRTQRWNTAGQVVTEAFSAVGQAAAANQAATDSNTTKTVDSVYNAGASALQNAGGVAGIVGTAMTYAKMAGDVIQEMGGGTDQMTATDKWMDSAFFSWNIGMLNGFAGKKADAFGADMDALAAVGSSYGGTSADIQDASNKAGKKYGLFSSKARKKANEAIAKAKEHQNLMGDIADNATDQRLAVQSMGEQAGLSYSMLTGGGYDQKYTYAAKHGGILEWEPDVRLEWEPSLEWEPQIELNWELPQFKEGGNIDIVEELEWIPEFKSGGKAEESDIPETEETTQKNVIPEGALHKNKHHMEHAEGLTKKGIPVIDDEGEQQAEIEHSEIIFTLEVTKKLEEYYKIFYSDESSNKEKEQAALEAGHLLVYQILENTEDRTGLIDSCKKGGTLTLKKSTEDLIEEASEEVQTVIVVETEEANKTAKKSSDKDNIKDQMKEAIREVLVELLVK